MYDKCPLICYLNCAFVSMLCSMLQSIGSTAESIHNYAPASIASFITTLTKSLPMAQLPVAKPCRILQVSYGTATRVKYRLRRAFPASAVWPNSSAWTRFSKAPRHGTGAGVIRSLLSRFRLASGHYKILRECRRCRFRNSTKGFWTTSTLCIRLARRIRQVCVASNSCVRLFF